MRITEYVHIGLLIPILGLAFMGKDVPLALLFLALVSPIKALIERYLLIKVDKEEVKERMDKLEAALAETQTVVNSLIAASNMRSF